MMNKRSGVELPLLVLAAFTSMNSTAYCLYCSTCLQHRYTIGSGVDGPRRRKSRSATALDAVSYCNEEDHTSAAEHGSSFGPPGPIRDVLPSQSLTLNLLDTFQTPFETTITRISSRPHAFLLRNYLTETERHTILWEASSSPDRQPAETAKSAAGRSNCSVCWLPNHPTGGNRVPMSIARRTSKLLLHPAVPNSGNGAGVESLQVLRYGEGGQYVLHHDAGDYQNRVLTVIYYLNGVGGTFLPLAKLDQEDECLPQKHHHASIGIPAPPRTKEEALEMAEGLKPGMHGVCVGNSNEGVHGERDDSNKHFVSIRPGDAFAFYNFQDSGGQGGSRTMGADSIEKATYPEQRPPLEWHALHAGLPTDGSSPEKWIATNWFHAGEKLMMTKR